MTKDDRYRNWCFTCYNDIKDIDCVFMVYQTEICPTTKKEHKQGYIEFKDKCSMKKVKELFDDKSIHLEPRWGTQKQAIDYCTKKDTRKEGTQPFIKGNPKNQGNRKDLDEIYDDIEEGMTAKEILLRHRGNALRHMNMIKKGLMVFHDLDDVDKYILMKRGEDVEIDMKAIKCVVSDKTSSAKCDNPNFEPFTTFDGQ